MVTIGYFPTGGVEAEVARGQFLLPEGMSFQAPTGRFTLPDGSIFLEGGRATDRCCSSQRGKLTLGRGCGA